MAGQYGHIIGYHWPCSAQGHFGVIWYTIFKTLLFVQLWFFFNQIFLLMFFVIFHAGFNLRILEKKKKNTKKKKTRKKKQANKFHTPPCGEYEHFHFWKAAGRWGKGYLKYGHRGEQYKMEWFWPSTVLSGLASFDALENFRISAFCKKLLGLSFICQQTICQRFVTKVSFLYS